MSYDPSRLEEDSNTGLIYRIRLTLQDNQGPLPTDPPDSGFEWLSDSEINWFILKNPNNFVGAVLDAARSIQAALAYQVRSKLFWITA